MSSIYRVYDYVIYHTYSDEVDRTGMITDIIVFKDSVLVTVLREDNTPEVIYRSTIISIDYKKERAMKFDEILNKL